MDITYQSTRGGEVNVTASQAILKGLAKDGGLFMPNSMPKLDRTMKELSSMSYQDTAYEVMKLFFTDFTKEELKCCIERAYDSKFDTTQIAPLKKAGDAYYLELYHGSTIAFKDMALSILPHLMTAAAKKNQVKNKIVILTATSGDTGKAAMAGFADVEGTEIIVFYPKDGVSRVQELQMVTQTGKNTHVAAIHGNFDDAQTGVKKIFRDADFAHSLEQKGYQLSSANSINIGRLIPQVVYYVYAYAKLLASSEIEDGEKINVAVPTGNFGNILAAFFAKEVGVPIHKFICASNDNKVLYDFFQTGTYDKNRDFILTSSPSMDILISSNLERLIYLSTGQNAAENKKRMEELSETGSYEITPQMKRFMKDFVGGYAPEAKMQLTIRHLFEETGYLIDTHTGVAASVYEQYRSETKDLGKTVIASTASPYKFSGHVLEALEGKKQTEKVFQIIDHLAELSGTTIPQAVEEIRTAPVRHQTECDVDQMQEAVLRFLD